MTVTGWFADTVDDPPDPAFPWQAVLQAPGCVFPIDAWFQTEEDVYAFILHDVIGKGILP